MIRVYTQIRQGWRWLERYWHREPVFACVLGFTATGLLPGISAAGATPDDRCRTAIADGEFLVNGVAKAVHPLPPLTVGVSPAFISRAAIESLGWPLYLFDAGLPEPAAVEAIALGGTPANCLTTGAALATTVVAELFRRGWDWGEKLAARGDYIILSECVVGGTTTALAVLLALGIEASERVNSSHPQCNHAQKEALVRLGLSRANLSASASPLEVVAAVGDPMQVAVAAMALSASRFGGVLLAGGTQMLAVYKLAKYFSQTWDANLEQIVVGTTRWVAEDLSGDSVGLARLVGDVPLLATELSFATSSYPQLQAYERGFVKEGVGAGGSAIAAHLHRGWSQGQLLAAIEGLLERYYHPASEMNATG